ncbi:MAG: molybdopterin-dependent oxidoreductase, partial [Actinomycetota bacterium]|nr:molybdopterin-dependent oxidoreductase [Actinomycetota bacterium]
GRGAQPPRDGEIGALVISGDEAAYDPRVRALSERARFLLATSMFMGEATLSAHVVVPATSYLERDGTVVNLEGRRQRQRRAVDPPFPDELEFFSRVGERIGVPISPWPAVEPPAERASLPPPVDEAPAPAPSVPPVPTVDRDGGLELVTYRPLFSGPGVERISALAFQRPRREIELAADDAAQTGIATGDVVAVSSNGTSTLVSARVNRRLRAGVARMAHEHARELAARVEVAKA